MMKLTKGCGGLMGLIDTCYLLRNIDRDDRGCASIDARPRREAKCRFSSDCGLVLENQMKLAGNEDRRCR